MLYTCICWPDASGLQYATPTARDVVNVTCMRPRNVHELGHDDSGFVMNEELLAMPLEPGRLCQDGACCDACSRVQLPQVMTARECHEMMAGSSAVMPGAHAEHERAPREQHNLQLQFRAAAGDIRLHLLYIRLLERLRRIVAHEYGVNLRRLSVEQSFVSRLRCHPAPNYTQPAGALHVDECSTKNYHYTGQPAPKLWFPFVYSQRVRRVAWQKVSVASGQRKLNAHGCTLPALVLSRQYQCAGILYLSDRDDYEGGDFVFTDPPQHEVGVGALILPLGPV